MTVESKRWRDTGSLDRVGVGTRDPTTTTFRTALYKQKPKDTTPHFVERKYGAKTLTFDNKYKKLHCKLKLRIITDTNCWPSVRRTFRSLVEGFRTSSGQVTWWPTLTSFPHLLENIQVLFLGVTRSWWSFCGGKGGTRIFVYSTKE